MADSVKKKTSGTSKTAAAKKKKPAAPKKPTVKEQEAMQAQFREKRRFWSLILFFFGIFEVIVTFVEGDGLWNGLYRFNRGMLGMSVFVFGFFVIYMALSIASEKSKSAVIARAIQGGVMFFLLSGAAQIFFGGEITGTGFLMKIKKLYLEGVELHGGGVAGAVVGWTMQALFGSIGSKIIIVMLILLFTLLLSDLTLPQLFRAIAKPFIGAAKALKEDSDERTAYRDYSIPDDVYRAADPDFAHYDGLEPEPVRLEKQPPAPRERQRDPKRKKKRPIDFAKVHQAQLERIRAEEEKAKLRADGFYQELPGEEQNGQTVQADNDNTVQPDILPETAADMTAENNAAETEWAETIEGGESMGAPAETQTDGPAAEEKSKKKKSDKPPTRAEIVAEERQKMEEQIQLDELIKKAAANSNRKGVPGTAPEAGGDSSPAPKPEMIEYVYPPVELLHENDRRIPEDEIQREIQDKSARLVETLETFGVKTRIIGIHRGPAVTRYELQPAAGVKVRQVTNLADDIALNLAADSIRIEAPIPGKPAIGIEIPNVHRDSVSMRELIDSRDYRHAKGKLSFAVGKDIEGNIVIGDISAMPHMLIAGTTGSGKSVFTNSIILNILFHATPDEVKLILIDPKKVEFPMYNGIPHLLIPVVTEPLKAAGALGWAVNEMMRRYKLFEANGTKNLEDYNEMVQEMLDSDPDCERTKLPQIVIVVDEFADLMLAAKNEVEESVMRLAQLARAAGMHMLIATQSPRVDVITGLIKANIPSRTALMVSNMKDSMVILDKVGAEKLLGRGDMLYQPVGMPKPMRIQSGFASTAEIRSIVDFLKQEHGADYDQEIVHEVEQNMPKPKGDDNAEIAINPDDDLVNQAITIIVETGNASTAFLQRKLKLGFPRAARIMDDIEAMGIIGPQEGAKPRKINITKDEWYERQGRS